MYTHTCIHTLGGCAPCAKHLSSLHCAIPRGCIALWPDKQPAPEAEPASQEAGGQAMGSQLQGPRNVFLLLDSARRLQKEDWRRNSQHLI
eukprot:scaffold67328_cov16-Tisochrysis_lutea.AAC.1